MRVIVRGQHVQLNDSMRDTIDRRLAFALSRFAERIRSTEVQLADINGPRGGVDKRCTITVRIPGAGPVVIEDEDASFHAAVARAFDRLERAVARVLDRRRNTRKRNVRKAGAAS